MHKLIYYSYLTLARAAMFLMYIGRSIRQMMVIMPSHRKTIIFHLEQEGMYRQDDGMGRYVYLTLNRFTRAGYNVYLYKNVRTFDQYLKLGKYGRFLYSLPHFKIISRIPRNMSTPDTYFAFDRFNLTLFANRWKKLIYVNICRPTICQIGSVIPIPYFFHPTANKINIQKNIKKMRKRERGLKIIFAGNSIESGYSVKKIRDWYGKTPRYEGVQAVRQLGDRVKNIMNSQEFCRSISKDNYICFP